jgi:hypothetical protein
MMFEPVSHLHVKDEKRERGRRKDDRWGMVMTK